MSELTGERYRLEFEESREYGRPEVRLADRVGQERILWRMNAVISLYCLGEPPCSLAAWCPPGGRIAGTTAAHPAAVDPPAPGGIAAENGLRSEAIRSGKGKCAPA